MKDTSVANAKTAVKSTEKGIKTAGQTSKATIKTAEATAKAAEKSAQATAKAAKASAQAAKATAKAAAASAKAVAKATVATVKAIIAALKSLISAIAAGGWVAVVVIVVIAVIAVVMCSCFGIFFSSEDTGSSQTMYEVVREINEEYTAELDEIKVNDIEVKSQYEQNVDITNCVHLETRSGDIRVKVNEEYEDGSNV